jgi:hypothetical protein
LSINKTRKEKIAMTRSSIIHFGFQKRFPRRFEECMSKENLQFDRIGKDKRIRLARIHWTSTQNDSQSTSLPPLIFLIKVSPLPSHVHNNLPFCHCPHQSEPTSCLSSRAFKGIYQKKIIISSHIPRWLCRAINVDKYHIINFP